MALSFGATASAYGLTQTTSKTETAAVAEARAETGKMNARKAYSVAKTYTQDLILTGSLPSAGTLLSIGGMTNAVVEEINTSESNTGYSTGSLRVTQHDSETAAAIS